MHKQTNRQTDRHYESNGHLAVNQLHKFVVFETISRIKDEKSAAKFHYIKTISGKVVAQLIAFRVVSIYWQGVAPFP